MYTEKINPKRLRSMSHKGFEDWVRTVAASHVRQLGKKQALKRLALEIAEAAPEIASLYINSL